MAIKIPTGWGMFSSAGNRRLTGYANTLSKNASDEISKFHKAAKKYIKSWENLEGKEGFRESGDTMVRESVWSFLLEVGERHAFNKSFTDELWDKIRDELYTESKQEN